MTIGYEINGYDNDSYMTGSSERLFDLPFLPKCNKCGYRTDYRYTNKDFKIRRKTFDFSSTFDGVTIVSLKFKEFCNRYCYNNLVFVELAKSPNFFQFYIEGNFLNYSATLKENFCNICEHYENVIGPSINVDNFTNPLEDGFYQSELWYGSGNEKSPILIVSPVTKENFLKEKFKNLCLTKIESKDGR